MIKQSHEKHPKQADWPRNSLNARFDPPRAVYNLQFVVWFIVGKWEVTRVVRGSIWNISATCSSESRLCSESMLPGDLFKLNPFLHPLGWGVKQLKQKKKTLNSLWNFMMFSMFAHLLYSTTRSTRACKINS